MSTFEIGAIIVFAFLMIGVAVGVLAVMALPQIRYYRKARKYLEGGDWQEPPNPGEDEGPPRWPEG